MMAFYASSPLCDLKGWPKPILDVLLRDLKSSVGEKWGMGRGTGLREQGRGVVQQCFF